MLPLGFFRATASRAVALALAPLLLPGLASGQEAEAPSPLELRMTEYQRTLQEVRRMGPAALDSAIALGEALADSLVAAGETAGGAQALQNAAFTGARAGQLDRAHEMMERATALARESGDESRIASVANTAAIAMAMDSEYARAIERWEDALASFRRQEDRYQESRVLGNLANAYSLSGQIVRARQLTEEAIIASRDAGNRFGVASSHNRLAGLLHSMFEYEAALAQADSAIAKFTELGGDASACYARRAVIHYDRGDVEAAQADFEAAEREAQLQGNVRGVMAFRGNQIQMLVQEGRPQDALAIAEDIDFAVINPLDHSLIDSYVALALLDLERWDDADTRIAEGVERFEALRAQEGGGSSLFERAGSVYSVQALAHLHREEWEDAWNAVERGKAAGLREALGLSPVRLGEIQEVLRAAGNTAILEIAEGITDRTPWFVVTADTLYHGAISELRLEDLAAAQELLSSGASASSCDPVLARISDALLTSVLRVLPDSLEQLYIVPLSHYAGFPWEILPLESDDGAPTRLGDRFAISYLSASWFLPRLHATTPPRGGTVIFADPTGDESLPAELRGEYGPLPYAREEADRIRAGADRVLVAEAASADAFSREAGDASVLHFATHAALNVFAPEESGIVLAGAERPVTALDVETKELRAELVTLSGCRTFGGFVLYGEGTLGLPRAFLTAGCQSVVASLWDVEDRAAAEFMGRFYRALREGAPRAVALQTARRALADGGHPPRDYAAFILTGLGHTPVGTLAGTASTFPGRTFALAGLGLLGLFLAVRALRRG